MSMHYKARTVYILEYTLFLHNKRMHSVVCNVKELEAKATALSNVIKLLVEALSE